jgi:Activator of Hsp90 ATPase homolog 1-like protein
MPRSPFVYVTYINTTPEKLWEALTDGEFTRQYWGGRRIESESKVGSSVRHVREDGSRPGRRSVTVREAAAVFLHVWVCRPAKGIAAKRHLGLSSNTANGLRRETYFDSRQFRAGERDLRDDPPWLASDHVKSQEPSRERQPAAVQGLGFGPSSKEPGRA